MPGRIFQLSSELVFPNPAYAKQSGLLAVGGDLRPERLLQAYSQGIFPWYSEPNPILWWSPPVRPVLHPGQIRINRSLAKTLRRKPYEIRLDTATPEVIGGCAKWHGENDGQTWITEDMQAAYTTLHHLGYVHSAEAWLDGELVGGLYGVALGKAFFGESMFALKPDASKVAFAVLCKQLDAWGFELVDSQVSNEHTERFGTVEISRREFLLRVGQLVHQPGRVGKWELEPGIYP